MVTLAKRLEPIRILLGFIGAIAWLGSFQFHSFALSHNWTNTAQSSAGFTLGFASAFAGWVATQIFKGNFSKLVDPHPFLKWISIVMLGGLCLFGIIGGLIDVFGDTSNYFSAAFWVGAFVMGLCTAFVVELVDGI